MKLMKSDYGTHEAITVQPVTMSVRKGVSFEDEAPLDIDVLLKHDRIAKDEEKVEPVEPEPVEPVESVHHEETQLEIVSEDDLPPPRASPRAFPKPKAARRSSSTLKDTDFALRDVWAKHLRYKSERSQVMAQPSTTHETFSGGVSMRLPMSESTDRLPAVGGRCSMIAYPAQKKSGLLGPLRRAPDPVRPLCDSFEGF